MIRKILSVLHLIELQYAQTHIALNNNFFKIGAKCSGNSATLGIISRSLPEIFFIVSSSCSVTSPSERNMPMTSIPFLRASATRSEENTSELHSPFDLVCRLLLEK